MAAAKSVRGVGVRLSAVAFAAGLMAAPGGLRAQEPVVDGDEALRCAVERAVDMARLAQLREVVDRMPDAGQALDDLAAGESADADDDSVVPLVALGLAAAADDGSATLTELGRRLSSGTAPASQASVPLALGASVEIALERPGERAHVRLDSSGADGGSIVVLVSPVPLDGDGCAAAFDPVVRARVEGTDGIEIVARGQGPVRTATLMLHNVPDGSVIDIAVSDVVGAPGRLAVSAEAWPVVAPAPDEAVVALSVADGPVVAQDVSVDGDRVAIAVTVGEAGGTMFEVQGLSGAQPGVRVFRADDLSGGTAGDLVWSSAFVPVPGATVDLSAVLDPGSYVATVEELSGRPGTFLLRHSGGAPGMGPRVAGTVEIGGETPQVLGSDLTVTIAEPGWYAFATSSYDDVDPVMSLSDAGGALIQESDDAAFGLHPMIVAELEPGDYRIALDSFDGNTGDVTLGAWRVEPQTLALGTVGLQQEIPNDLSQPNFNAYIVPVEGNELVDIDVEGLGDFDSTLALYDSWNMIVWNADDDGGTGYGSRIIDSFEGSTILAIVRSYDGARGGAYAISAVDHAKMENIGETATVATAGGKPAEGNLPMESSIAWFRVPATDQAYHLVRIESETMPYLDVDLFLRQPDGYIWLDGLEGYEGVTEVGFEGATDDVFVLVRNPSGEGVGSFSVTVE